jgi:hypothetical protein
VAHFRSSLRFLMPNARVLDLNACVLCGEFHPSLSRCPCLRCYHYHDGPFCSNPCAICNRFHEGPCVGHFRNKCLFCGDSHQPFVSCPCPRCLERHPGNYCPNDQEWPLHPSNSSWTRFVADSCLICGQCHRDDTGCPCPMCHDWHDGDDCQLPSSGVSAVQPCQRCHVWHGADVCHISPVSSSLSQLLSRPRECMLHRAVAAVVNDNAVRQAVAPAHSDAASDYHDIGSMSVVCTHCGARFWAAERIQCCYEGSLILPAPVIPETLSNIILSSTVLSNLRSYNMAMAMASVGHHKSGFPDGVFTMSGRSYHRIGSLVPMTGQPPNFAQIYTVDTTVATDRRSEIFGDRLDRSVLSALHDELMLHNRCVSEFCRVAASDAHELVWTTDDNIMGMQMGSLVTAAGCKRSIVIQRQLRPRELQLIDDGHPLYHTLAYPLLFPTGSPGWFSGMSRIPADGSSLRLVSLHDYGRYILMHRER